MYLVLSYTFVIAFQLLTNLYLMSIFTQYSIGIWTLEVCFHHYQNNKTLQTTFTFNDTY